MTKHDPERADFIVDFYRFTLAETGKPPTVRETAKAVGLASTSAVHHHLKKLTTESRAVLLRPRGKCWCYCHYQASSDLDI